MRLQNGRWSTFPLSKASRWRTLGRVYLGDTEESFHRPEHDPSATASAIVDAIMDSVGC